MTTDVPQVLRSLGEKVEPARAALVLIDMVNDFIDPAGKTATRAARPIGYARSVIPAMRGLLDGARAAGVPVVHVQHTTFPNRAGASGPWLDARSRATFSVEDICLDGTWGQQIITELAPTPDETVVKKYRYSGFAGTNLDLVLRSRGVETVVCAGVSTNACVEATAREAFSNDYYVVIAGDCCASWDMELHDATLRTAAHRYATVVDSAELLAEWSQVQRARVA